MNKREKGFNHESIDSLRLVQAEVVADVIPACLGLLQNPGDTLSVKLRTPIHPQEKRNRGLFSNNLLYADIAQRGTEILNSEHSNQPHRETRNFEVSWNQDFTRAVVHLPKRK